MEKVAVQAGKAAPAIAIAGALVAIPQAQHAVAASGKPTTVTAQSHQADQTAYKGAQQTDAARLDSVSARTVTVSSTAKSRHAAQVTSTHYTVRSGDTLSKIATDFYHKAADWQYLYHENDKTISNPNLIYVGERLYIPATVPANYTLTDYVPKHAAPVASSDSSDSDRSSSSVSTGVTVVVQSANKGSADSSSGLSGTLGCSSLEQLWESAGGNPADAFMAAEIAMAESGGNQYAVSPTDDYGYWQINASHGALATFNAVGNAQAAISISDDGTDWYPWTTYTSGAYVGEC